MASRHAVHFSSARTDWCTPTNLYEELNRKYCFTLDAACSKDNALADKGFYWPEQDGLALSWRDERVWCNPPYGRQLPLWAAKASQEAKSAILIVMLVPSRTDTQWWHDAINTARPHFLKGRLRFKNASHSAPFPSALLIWNA